MGAQGIGEAFEGMLKVGQALLIIVLILSGLLCTGTRSNCGKPRVPADSSRALSGSMPQMVRGSCSAVSGALTPPPRRGPDEVMEKWIEVNNGSP